MVKLTAKETIRKHWIEKYGQVIKGDAKIVPLDFEWSAHNMDFLIKAMNEYAEQAFNAAQETHSDEIGVQDVLRDFRIHKFETWNDYLNSLK